MVKKNVKMLKNPPNAQVLPNCVAMPTTFPAAGLPNVPNLSVGDLEMQLISVDYN